MPRNFGPDSTPSPRIFWIRVSGILLAVVLWSALLAFFAGSGGCTGKSISLFNPSTGAKVATYSNTTDSEIGGLSAEFDAATGSFKVKVESSTQAASASNAAAFAAIEHAIDKIPVPVP